MTLIYELELECKGCEGWGFYNLKRALSTIEGLQPLLRAIALRYRVLAFNEIGSENIFKVIKKSVKFGHFLTKSIERTSMLHKGKQQIFVLDKF